MTHFSGIMPRMKYWLLCAFIVMVGCGRQDATAPETDGSPTTEKPHEITPTGKEMPKPATKVSSEELIAPETKSAPEIDYTPTGADKTSFSMADYEIVKPGMSKEEVFAILGKNGKVVSSETGVVMVQWMNDKDQTSSMTITFQDGKVSGKACAGLKKG